MMDASKTETVQPTLSSTTDSPAKASRKDQFPDTFRRKISMCCVSCDTSTYSRNEGICR